MAPQERQDAVSELNLNSPVIVNRVRQRASQEGGREVRQSVSLLFIDAFLPPPLPFPSPE